MTAELHQFLADYRQVSIESVGATATGGDAEIIRLLQQIANQPVSIDNLEITGTTQVFDLGSLQGSIDAINTFLTSTLQPALDDWGTETTLQAIRASITGFATQATSEAILAAIGQVVTVLNAQGSSSGSNTIDVSGLATQATLSAVNTKLDAVAKNSTSQSILQALSTLGQQTTVQAIYDRLGNVLTAINNSSSGGGTTIDVSSLATQATLAQLLTETQKQATEASLQALLTETRKIAPPTINSQHLGYSLVSFAPDTANVNSNVTLPTNLYGLTIVNATASYAIVTLPSGEVVVPAFGSYSVNHELTEVPISDGGVSVSLPGNVGAASSGGQNPHVIFNFQLFVTA